MAWIFEIKIDSTRAHRAHDMNDVYLFYSFFFCWLNGWLCVGFSSLLNNNLHFFCLEVHILKYIEYEIFTRSYAGFNLLLYQFKYFILSQFKLACTFCFSLNPQSKIKY